MALLWKVKDRIVAKVEDSRRVVGAGCLFWRCVHAEPMPFALHSDYCSPSILVSAYAQKPRNAPPHCVMCDTPVCSVAAPFVLSVECVILRGAGEQVRGVDTRRVVATVANMETVRDGAVVQYVAVAMGVFVPRADEEMPISSWKSTGSPEPAIAGLIDLGPEALFGGFHDRASLSVD